MAKQHRFLVVEDYPATARSIARILRPYGEVSIAPDIAAARDALSRQSDWCGGCLDIELPDGSGLDLLAELREERPWFPVIVLTGFRDEAFVNRVQALNAYFALKPFTTDGLGAFAKLAIERLERPSPLQLVRDQAKLEWGLTPREGRVLDLAVEGLTIEEIAQRLRRSHHVVISHSRAIRAKAGHKSTLIDVVREILARVHRQS